MKRNKLLSFAMRCLSATLLFFFFLAEEGHTQQVDFCGEYHKADNPVPTDSVYYMDRFGNYYTAGELTTQNSSSTSGQLIAHNHCPGNMFFQLDFEPISDFTNDEMESITCAFVEISQNLNPPVLANLPRIRITKSDSLPVGAAAVGSPLWRTKLGQCNISESSVWQKLHTIVPNAAVTGADAIIKLERNGSWSHFPNLSPTALDLFTVALHEGLHGLGFASRQKDTVGSMPTSAFSTWDQLLFNRDSSRYLLREKGIGSCGCPTYGLPNFFNYDPLLQGCNQVNLRLGCDSDVAVNTTFVGSNANSISHLCDPNTVMFPSLSTNERKRIDAQTRDALCRLGYHLSNTGVTTCTPRTFLQPVDVSLNMGTSNTVMIDLNTILAQNNLTVGTAEIRLAKAPTFVVNYTRVGQTSMYNFINSPVYPTACGQFVFEYIITQTERCTNSTDTLIHCSKGRLFVFKSCKDLPTSNPLTCNLVLKGSIDSIRADLWVGGITTHFITEYTNFDLLNIPYQNKLTGSNVQLVTNSLTDKFIRFVYPNSNEGRVPAMYFRLKKTLVGGKQYRLSYRKRAANNGTLNFAFCTSPPCTPMATMGFLLNQPITATDCTPFPRHIVTHNFTASPNPAVWDNAPIPAIANPITLPANLNANYLIVYGNRGTTFPIPAGQNTELLLDDIEVIALEDAQISIEAPNPAVVACKGGNATINFKVTNTANTAVTGTFTLIPRVPAGMTLISPASTGILVTLGQGGTPKGSQIIPIIVSVGNVTAPFDVSFDFVRVIKPTDNACLASNQRARVTVQAATPANAAFTINNTLNCQNLVLSMSASSTTGLKRWSIREVDFNNVAIGTYTHFSTASNPTFDFNVAPFNAVNKRYQIVLRDSLISGPCTTLDITTQFVYRPDCTPALCPCTTSASHNIRATASNGEILYSNTTLKSNRALSNCATVTGTLVLDETTTFTGMTFMMQPGSKIKVNATTAAGITIDSSWLRSCTNRWQGIDVNQNAVFNIKRSTVENSENALILRNGVQGEIKGNNFNKNYIGINVQGIQNSTAPTAPAWNIKIYNNIFDCDANLLPPTAAFANNTGTKGYAAITSSFASFNIGQDAVLTNKNTIRNVRNGILGIGSSINSYFTDIYYLINIGNTNHTDPYIINLFGNPAFNISHTGIAVMLSNLKVYDNNINGLSNGLSKAIHMENSLGFDMRRTHINSAVSGIFNINSNALFKVYDDNWMRTRKIGYRLFDCANANVNYSRNFGTEDNGNALSSGSVLFQIEAPNVGTTGTKLINHFLSTVTSEYSGIKIENDGRYEITGSFLGYSDNRNNEYDGIGLINSHQNKLVKNETYPPGNGGIAITKGKGINIKNSINNTLCCNRPWLNSGIEFTGSCNGTVLTNTTFNSGGKQGLLLNTNAIIDPQGDNNSSNQNVYNVWSNLPFSVGSAINNSPTIFIKKLSEFKVRDHVKEFPVGVDPDWFSKAHNGVPNPCNDIQAECGVILNPLKTNGADRNEKPIPISIVAYANGLPNVTYGNFLQHEGSKWALAELENNVLYLGRNTTVDRFYVNTFNSNIRRLNDIEALIAQFNAPTAQEQAARDVIYNDMDEIDEQINALDAVYSTLSESAKIQNMQERKVLFEQRFTKFKVLLAQQEVIKNRTDSLLLQAEEINYYIAPTDVLETNEKKINALYFKTLARGITQLSDTDKQIVASLTPLCPMIAGKGVYRARLLEKLYTYTTYQDNENCIVNTNPGGGEGSRIAKKQNDLSKDMIKVYPNPTHDLLTIEAATTAPYKVIIRDVTGRLLHEEDVNYQTQISVADYIGGLYICEFWQNNKCISKEKIIIIH